MDAGGWERERWQGSGEAEKRVIGERRNTARPIGMPMAWGSALSVCCIKINGAMPTVAHELLPS